MTSFELKEEIKDRTEYSFKVEPDLDQLMEPLMKK